MSSKELAYTGIREYSFLIIHLVTSENESLMLIVTMSVRAIMILSAEILPKAMIPLIRSFSSRVFFEVISRACDSSSIDICLYFSICLLKIIVCLSIEEVIGLRIKLIIEIKLELYWEYFLGFRTAIVLGVISVQIMISMVIAISCNSIAEIEYCWQGRNMEVHHSDIMMIAIFRKFFAIIKEHNSCPGCFRRLYARFLLGFSEFFSSFVS